jgi:hypothetical protein
MVSVQLLLCALVVEEAVQIGRKAYGNVADDDKVPRPWALPLLTGWDFNIEDQKVIAFTPVSLRTH